LSFVNSTITVAREVSAARELIGIAEKRNNTSIYAIIDAMPFLEVDF